MKMSFEDFLRDVGVNVLSCYSCLFLEPPKQKPIPKTTSKAHDFRSKANK